MVGNDEEEAFLTFRRELLQHRDEILEAGTGLFFSFSTDPMQREEIALTMRCVQVFCAVMAVMAVMPYTPSADIVFRSACMPAPPEESEPAMVRQE